TSTAERAGRARSHARGPPRAVSRSTAPTPAPATYRVFRVRAAGAARPTSVRLAATAELAARRPCRGAIRAPRRSLRLWAPSDGRFLRPCRLRKERNRRRIEFRNVLGHSTSHEIALRNDRLVDPGGTGVHEIGLERRPRGDRPSVDGVGFDHAP